MGTDLEFGIQRWIDAGLINAETAQSIRLFEQQSQADKRNWPMIVAVVFGALMLGAGILLFVAAHWQNLSPWSRFTAVLVMVVALHLVGIFTGESSPKLSVAMHTIGTISAGGGIFLTGQIFNLQEHWPTGVLLWAVAAWLGWMLLRQWPQLIVAAVLTPAWLLSEWEEATRHFSGSDHIPIEGALLLAIAYFTAGDMNLSAIRKALIWIGGLSVIPAYLCLELNAGFNYYWQDPKVPLHLRVLGWSLALLIPLLIAFLLRGRRAWPIIGVVIWVVVAGHLPFEYKDTSTSSLGLYAWHTLGPYLWGAAGAIGVISWGVNDRAKHLVNFGMVVFVINLIAFYFSDLLDKLGRSVSLIGFGILFLVIGYFLERTRKHLIARIGEATA
jgi:hypothetical protein